MFPPARRSGSRFFSSSFSNNNENPSKGKQQHARQVQASGKDIAQAPIAGGKTVGSFIQLINQSSPQTLPLQNTQPKQTPIANPNKNSNPPPHNKLNLWG